VEVGVVTGYNDFFVVTKKEAESMGDGVFFTTIISGARDLQGINVSAYDLKLLTKQNRPLFLLNTSEPIENLPLKLRNYLIHGAKQEINYRFKCRTREPWYAVPSVWPADALLLRQAGEVPKLVHLTKKCTSTDTIHRVKWYQPSLGKCHVAGFLNTWTLIACELTGRSYGGGVLELMPGEANDIPMPPPTIKLKVVFETVDELIRIRQFDKAIQLVDKIVTPANITHSQHDNARNILCKLIKRRKTKQNGYY
jgi:adenine-specific DNA-methyltransferase